MGGVLVCVCIWFSLCVCECACVRDFVSHSVFVFPPLYKRNINILILFNTVRLVNVSIVTD